MTLLKATVVGRKLLNAKFSKYITKMDQELYCNWLGIFYFVESEDLWSEVTCETWKDDFAKKKKKKDCSFQMRARGKRIKLNPFAANVPILCSGILYYIWISLENSMFFFPLLVRFCFLPQRQNICLTCSSWEVAIGNFLEFTSYDHWLNQIGYIPILIIVFHFYISYPSKVLPISRLCSVSKPLKRSQN